MPGVVRDLGKTLQALEDRIVVTCSATNQIHVSTANVVAHSAETTISGRIIDRLDQELRVRYRTAEPFAYLWATRGSTEADRKLTLNVYLQHGDSSAGGDMASLSTAHDPTLRTFFTTFGTTPMGSWSTGPLYGQTEPAVYDLTGAKQFLRVQVVTNKTRLTTESSGDESYHVGAAIRFGLGEQLPDIPNTTGAGSTSTST